MDHGHGKQPSPDGPRLDCRFYRTAMGREPVREWLKGLPSTARKEIGSDLQLVQWRWPVGRPLVGGIGDGLYEVRSRVTDSAYRVLFCIEGSLMVLLHGFEKKTRRTPRSALELARRRKHHLENTP